MNLLMLSYNSNRTRNYPRLLKGLKTQRTTPWLLMSINLHSFKACLQTPGFQLEKHLPDWLLLSCSFIQAPSSFGNDHLQFTKKIFWESVESPKGTKTFLQKSTKKNKISLQKTWENTKESPKIPAKEKHLQTLKKPPQVPAKKNVFASKNSAKLSKKLTKPSFFLQKILAKQKTTSSPFALPRLSELPEVERERLSKSLGRKIRGLEVVVLGRDLGGTFFFKGFQPGFLSKSGFLTFCLFGFRVFGGCRMPGARSVLRAQSPKVYGRDIPHRLR